MYVNHLVTILKKLISDAYYINKSDEAMLFGRKETNSEIEILVKNGLLKGK